MDRLSKLKVKGLVIGPLHVAPPDDAVSLRFEEISPETGNLEQFKGFIQAAHKKGGRSCWCRSSVRDSFADCFDDGCHGDVFLQVSPWSWT